MTKVYLAFYKGRKSGDTLNDVITRLFESATQIFTHGNYSHVEIAIQNEKSFTCYSSSMRDGGVRCKTMSLPEAKWDLVPVDVIPTLIEDYFEKTKSCKYDIRGALGCVFPSRESSRQYFCSEWCFNAITNSNQGWRFSPNDLFTIANHLTTKRA